jgi:hypothetical protein
MHLHFRQVIEPRWHEMEERMAAASDMDAVLTSHAELQDLVLKECLLTNQDLLKVLTKTMTICLLFAEQVFDGEPTPRLHTQAPNSYFPVPRVPLLSFHYFVVILVFVVVVVVV